MQLCWDHQFQFAGYYAAQWQGYYEEAGLDVEIRSAYREDGRFLRAIDEVAAGRAQFGVGAADILVARGKGVPLVVAASIFQHSAAEIYVRKDSGIGGASDLTGARVVRRPGDLFEVELQAMLRAEGVDPASLIYEPITNSIQHYYQLMRGEVDAILGYRLTTPYMLKKLGMELNVLRPMSYGVDFYGDSLFTTEDVVEHDPAMVQAFVRASLKGWEYALDHAEEVSARISSELPRVRVPLDTREFNLSQVEGVKQLCPYPHVELLGHMNPDRWRQMAEILKANGLMEKDIDVERLVYDRDVWNDRFRARFQRWLLMGLVALGVVALIVILWAVSLRKVVARRTGQLTQANTKLKAQVAERRRAEHSLRESEERFRQMVENIHVFFWVMDVGSGALLYASPGYEYIWERGVGELLDSPRALFETLLPEDVRAVERTLDEARAGRPSECECRIRRPDGSLHWVRWRVFPVADEAGDIYRMAGVAADITKRKIAEDLLRESEDRYRTIAENLPGGMLLLDEDMRVVAANATFRKWFPDSDFTEGRHCFALVGRSDPCPICPCTTLFEDGQVQTLFKELPVGGGIRMFKVIACPVHDNEGRVRQAVVMYSDVTEEVKLNEQLQRATRTELLATMSSGIAHEVNQPLNAVKLWTTGLMMVVEKDGGIKPETLLEQLGKVQGAADRIASVIDHMRMLIRDSGDVEVAPVDLNLAVKRSLTLMSAKLAYHGIRLKLDLAPSASVVLANGIQLEQVIINLMANAIDIHDTHERRDKLVNISTVPDGDHVFLVVEDNGPGFADEPEKIFEPFYTTKKQGGSMGLGLALVQTFVRSWEGEIKAARSEALKGARIEVSLLRGD